MEKLTTIEDAAPTPTLGVVPSIPPADQLHSSANIRQLRSRDWLILPLLCLLTISLIVFSAEFTARRVFSESQKTLASCMILNDPTTGPRGIPNSACREKNAEANWITTRFDRCGYRNDTQCGPKPPGTYRIVMTGSSVALGERVEREQSFAAKLPIQLTQKTGRPVELYNEGMNFGFARNTDLRFNDVLSQNPDLILWIITPSDIDSADFNLPGVSLQHWNQQGLAAKAWHRVAGNFANQPFASAAAEVLGRTRTALMLRHFLYQSQSEYLKSYESAPDPDQGFLKSKQSPAWAKHLKQVDTYAADMESRAQAANIPFVATLVPNRAQSAMISDRSWPNGYDPYYLDRELASIVTAHGGAYLSIAGDFEHIPNPEKYYLAVDGHPNPEGHSVISALLLSKLTSGAVPALQIPQPSSTGQPQSANQPKAQTE